MRWLIIKLLWHLNLYSKARILWRLYDHVHIFRRLQEKKFFSQFVKKGDLCFDVGACYGDKTKVFLKLGAAKVICVEPSKICINHLNKVFRNNINVVIVNKGVADKKGFMKLYTSKAEPAIATMNTTWKRKGRFKVYSWDYSYRVPITTLDQLIQQYGMPAFCKIDVEGFELSVLKGLTKPIRSLSFEFHKENLEDAKQAMEYLTALGDISFNYSIHDKLLLSRWITAQILYQKLSDINDSNLCGDIYARFKKTV